MTRSRTVLVLGVLAVGAFAPPAGAAFVVAPGGNEAALGNAQSPGPFRFYGTGGSRNQVVYDAGFFATGPVLVQAVSFRPFANFGSLFFGNTLTVSDVTITLSTTPRGGEGPGQPSESFASNVGADVRTVFSGPLTLSTAFTPAAGGTLAFDYTVRFQQPFLYDPAAGNLLLDVLVPTTATVGGNGLLGFVTFDTVNTLNDGIFAVVANSNGAAASGVLSTAGPVTRFEVTPTAVVPAPAGVVLAAAGIGTVLLGRVRRRG